MAGHIEAAHSERVEVKKKALKSRLGRAHSEAFQAIKNRFLDNYWIAVDTEMQAINAKLMWSSDQAKIETGISISVDKDSDRSRVAIYTKDRPGLFAKLSGALAVLGANIVDAKVFTTPEGMVLDVFWLQDHTGRAFAQTSALARMSVQIERANNGTNAALNAPSANNLRKTLGNCSATKNASVTWPAPRRPAIRISRTNPSTRLPMVQPPTVAIDLKSAMARS